MKLTGRRASARRTAGSAWTARALVAVVGSALDRTTGEIVWKLPGGNVTSGSPVLGTFGIQRR